MTTAAPLARYGAIEGALASGFATAELHHFAGHDPVFARPERLPARLHLPGSSWNEVCKPFSDPSAGTKGSSISASVA
ncbi:hypothetical protein [Mesorhizobium sp. WSM3876]|uniref:hypothetical protein n=1 Tax=Mesorhizobium sp. WSM3876 TaxID=422277 RepID=UPI000BAEFD0E|nr:hypothetical protein [Mesorhizobium sp. WSM3876]PBB86626.1 hypothetical protein CK216_10100 [Mesorhizobium sp. WSM3876]